MKHTLPHFIAAPLRWPIERLVHVICAVTWVVRFLFLAVPSALSGDENGMLAAGALGNAAEFWHSGSWAVRWEMLERFSAGGRIFWALSHFAWGMILPSAGPSAFALSMLAGLVAMMALAGAGERLWGRRGYLFCLLFASLSPYFLNYTIRILATMQMAMWLCIALYCFSAPRWSARTWIGGGLALGFAFGTHYGSGPAILALTVGLAVALVRTASRAGTPGPRRLCDAVFFPILGAASAVAPLAALEAWSLRAGSAFHKRFFEIGAHGLPHFTHENLTAADDPGPHGLWLRILFEMEPLLQALLVAALIATFRRSNLAGTRKAAFGAFALVLLGLLLVGLGQSVARSWISLILFGAVGFALAFSNLFSASVSESPQASEPGSAPPPPQAAAAMLPALLSLILIMTLFRPASYEARQVFAAWPVFVLALAGLVVTAFNDSFDRMMRATALLGAVIFALGAWAALREKTAPERALQFGRANRQMAPTDYHAITKWDGLGQLEGRASEPIHVVGAPVILYPATAYEEEPFKITGLRQKLKEHHLDHLLTAEEVIYATCFTEPKPADGAQSFPPAGTPLIPSTYSATGINGASYKPREHPDRGLELIFPLRTGATQTSDTSETMQVRLELPSPGDEESVIGFEAMAVGPYCKEGTKLTVAARVDDVDLGIFEIPISAIAGPTRLYWRNIRPKGKTAVALLSATLQVPAGDHLPAAVLYISRPFITAYQTPPKSAGISGFQSLVDAELTTPRPSFPGEWALMSTTYPEAGGYVSKPVRWRTAEWTGRAADFVVFAIGFEFRPTTELTVNGRRVLTFEPVAADQSWAENGYELFYKHISEDQGSHGFMFLRLPEGAATAGEPLELCLKIVGGTPYRSWIGLPEIKNPAEYLQPGFEPPMRKSAPE